ncbi:PREDICTED: F-box only protein 31-like [Myotis brandtii]|uniref:F-box only protein 31-like n=1 Tax=Myotis brandtii TaxID=109478 RepID=UPI0007045672|nr:PREDICTED: F-box only protein 31-like [Myotis brandtii]
MEGCACFCGVGSSGACMYPQKHQCPAEKAAANDKLTPAEKHFELDTAGGAVPGTDLPNLAQACTKFHYILHIDSIWRRRCREEFGVCENLQNLEMMGMSYREVYAKLFPYRNILGWWQLDTDHFRILVNNSPDGEETSHGGVHGRPHNRHMQIRKDRFTTQCKNTDHGMDFPTRLREEGEEWGLLLEDRQRFDWLTYRRLYLPPSHPDNLIRPGLFQYDYDSYGLKIAMLSFHGKYARVTKITGVSNKILEIHLMRRIQLRDGEIFCNFNQLSHVVQEIEEQVIWEQQQQQQEDWTEESMGHSWQSPAQPRVGESRASTSEEQPVPFVLPVGVVPRDRNYPRTCRMCFYAVDTFTLLGSADRWRLPGVFILFDENHFGFISLEVLGTDLPSLAQACTQLHHILHIDSIWRRRCQEEFGIRDNLQNLEMMGMSYREVYAKLFPYRNILGLWQLDAEHYRTLVNVVVDGLGITGWTYGLSLNTHVDGPLQFKPPRSEFA